MANTQKAPLNPATMGDDQFAKEVKGALASGKTAAARMQVCIASAIALCNMHGNTARIKAVMDAVTEAKSRVFPRAAIRQYFEKYSPVDLSEEYKDWYQPSRKAECESDPAKLMPLLHENPWNSAQLKKPTVKTPFAERLQNLLDSVEKKGTDTEKAMAAIVRKALAGYVAEEVARQNAARMLDANGKPLATVPTANVSTH